MQKGRLIKKTIVQNTILLAIACCIMALVMYMTIDKKVEVSIGYSTTEQGAVQLFYASDSDAFDDMNFIKLPVAPSENLELIYEIDRNKANAIRVDFEDGLRIIQLMDISYKYCGMTIKRYSGQDIKDDFDIQNSISIDGNEELLSIEIDGFDPYIGISNTNVLSSIKMFDLIVICLLLMLLAACIIIAMVRYKANCKIIFIKCLIVVVSSICIRNLIVFDVAMHSTIRTQENGNIRTYYNLTDQEYNEEMVKVTPIIGENYFQEMKVYLDYDKCEKTMIAFELDNMVELLNIKFTFMGMPVSSFSIENIQENSYFHTGTKAVIVRDTLQLSNDSGQIVVMELKGIEIDQVIDMYRWVFAILAAAIIGILIPETIVLSIRNHHIVICIFVGILTIPTFVYNLSSDKDVNIENRILQEKPKFDATTLNEYPADFESYYNDNIPFKAELVSLHSQIMYNLFTKSAVDKVILGQENWLFYALTLNDYLHNNTYTNVELEAAKNKLLLISGELNERGIDFYIMVPPNKNTVYSEYMPKGYYKECDESRNEQLLNYLEAETDLKIINPLEDLLAEKEKNQLYYKWDTHWNENGAYVGFRTIMNKMDLENTMPLSDLEVIEQQNSYGDLKGMMGIDVKGFDTKYDISYKSDIIVDLNKHIEATATTADEQYYTSNGDIDSKLLMFRDSFSTALIPYINKTFNESVFIWTCFDMEVVDRESPDIVIWEVVERDSSIFMNLNY